MKGKKYNEVQHLAHKLKGVTANLRLDQLSAIATRLEETAALRDQKESRRQLRELIKALKSTKIHRAGKDAE